MLQVEDAPERLDTMMADLRAAAPIFHPTNYWERYQRRFIPYLKRHGLRDFRRSRHPWGGRVLASFGARDLLDAPFTFRRLESSKLLNNALTAHVPGWLAALEGMQPGVEALARRFVRKGATLEEWRRLRYAFTAAEGERAGARPLSDLSASLAGNPEDAFAVDGRSYTSLLLYYYLRYAYVARHVDLDAVDLCVELGSGSGKQAEVLHKLHPNVTLCLFDLPPQLYVCHQYLEAVFPDAVVPYETTREWTSLDDVERGRIYLFGNWHFPLIEGARVGLFWNAASFGEMEPDVVANYLRYVGSAAERAYLMQLMTGKERAPRRGRHGVLEPTTLEHYRSGLSAFRLVDRRPSLMPTAVPMAGYEDSFWTR